MSNYGIKISKDGYDVNTPITKYNKKYFQIISSEGCLIRKELSTVASNVNMFSGYRLSTDKTKAYPINSNYGNSSVYIIFGNKFND